MVLKMGLQQYPVNKVLLTKPKMKKKNTFPLLQLISHSTLNWKNSVIGNTKMHHENI